MPGPPCSHTPGDITHPARGNQASAPSPSPSRGSWQGSSGGGAGWIPTKHLNQVPRFSSSVPRDVARQCQSTSKLENTLAHFLWRKAEPRVKKRG